MTHIINYCSKFVATRFDLKKNFQNRVLTYCRRSSAGPPFSTSLTAIAGSPVTKCGLSRPPETAMPIRRMDENKP